MEKALSHITVLPETRQQVNHFVDLCAQEALSGDYDLIKIATHIKALQDVADGLRERLGSHILDEMAKHGKGDHVQASAKFAIKTRTTYDLASTGDSKWHELKEELAKRERFLKALKEPVSDMSGEIIEPPVVKQSEYYTITLI